jgi:hypothetical protein
MTARYLQKNAIPSVVLFQLRLRLTCVQEEVQRLATCQIPNQQQNVQNSESTGKEKQDAARLQNLNTEFSELLSELHRRNSAAVGGNSPLFEVRTKISFLAEVFIDDFRVHLP